MDDSFLSFKLLLNCSLLLEASLTIRLLYSTCFIFFIAFNAVWNYIFYFLVILSYLLLQIRYFLGLVSCYIIKYLQECLAHWFYNLLKIEKLNKHWFIKRELSHEFTWETVVYFIEVKIVGFELRARDFEVRISRFFFFPQHILLHSKWESKKTLNLMFNFHIINA